MQSKDDISVENVRRLRAVAKILATGAIRVAALSVDQPRPQIKKSASSCSYISEESFDCGQPIDTDQPVDYAHKAIRVELNKKE